MTSYKFIWKGHIIVNSQTDWLKLYFYIIKEPSAFLQFPSPKPCPGTADLILWSINIKIVSKHKNEWK